MSDGLTNYNRTTWKTVILEQIQLEGGALSPYQLICDYGNYDDAYEIGRVVQMMYDKGEIAFDEHWKMIVVSKVPKEVVE